MNQLLFACTARTHAFAIFVDYLDVTSFGSWHPKWHGPSACFEFASAKSDGGSMGEKSTPGEPYPPCPGGPWVRQLSLEPGPARGWAAALGSV